MPNSKFIGWTAFTLLAVAVVTVSVLPTCSSANVALPPKHEAEAGAEHHRCDLSKIDSAAWNRAIQRATEHRSLQAGGGQFTLMRVFLDGVEPDNDIDDKWDDALDAKTGRASPSVPEKAPHEPAHPGVVPLIVNGVKLFLPGLLDTPPEGMRDPPACKRLQSATNDPGEIQLSSVKLVSLKTLTGGGMYRELRNSGFVLVEHINSTQRNAGRDPVHIGSYTHGQTTVWVAAPPRGQLGIAGDVVLLRQAKEDLGRIVAEIQFETDEPITVRSLRLGPVVVGGPYGWSYEFNNDAVCTTDLLPSGIYRILPPDFDMVKSRWVVTVKPGQTTHLKFTARSQKVLDKFSEETAPLASAPSPP